MNGTKKAKATSAHAARPFRICSITMVSAIELIQLHRWEVKDERQERDLNDCWTANFCRDADLAAVSSQTNCGNDIGVGA